MLEGLQADFADQANEQIQLKTQLESAHSQHSELQAAKSAEVDGLAQQLTEHQESAKALQVSNSCAHCRMSRIAAGGDSVTTPPAGMGQVTIVAVAMGVPFAA